MGLDRVAPGLFVLLWASGFLVARAVVGHAEPLSFLCLRFVLTIAVFGAYAIAWRARWPRDWIGWRDPLITGALLQGAYLGGVFWAVSRGLPAGLAGLIAGLQPLLTGVLAYPVTGERVRARQWLGLVVGLIGVALVLAPRLEGLGAVSPPGVLICVCAVTAGTLGTLWQKRTSAQTDLRTNVAVQFIGGLAVTLPVALLTEHGRIAFSWQVDAGLAFAVLGNSVGGMSLLLVMIRRGAVAKVATLFYLSPPITALLAFLIFGERLAAIQLVGMAVTCAGVLVARK